MSTPAAIAGTFVAVTPVASRKVVRLHIECPVEAADNILQALGGYPDPANPQWVAIARLKAEAEPETAEVKPKRRLSEMKNASQAALTCQQPAFWRYLVEEHQAGEIGSEDDAASFVRLFCGVQSRSELDSVRSAEMFWQSLRDGFQAWKTIA